MKASPEQLTAAAKVNLKTVRPPARRTELAAAPPRPEPRRSLDDWTGALLKNRNGEPKALLANALTALSQAPEWCGVLAFDEFAMATVVTRPTPWDETDGFAARAWTPRDDVLATDWLQHQGINVSVEVAAVAVETVAAEKCCHAVRNYLDALVWDGQPRLADWLVIYLGVLDTPYVRAVGERFLVSAVARVIRPGVKVDTMLILEGRQGAGKSTALSIPGDPWFSDEIGDLGSKDAALQARAAWIIELSELDAMSKAEATRTKAFLSRTADKFRPPYGRRVINAPRQCVFAGTTNGNSYLKDETGGRRFWPVTVEQIDAEALRQDRNQLWAEAVHRFRDGAPWWLDTSELTKVAAVEQAKRYAGDPWDDAVGRYLDRKSDTSIPEILRDCLTLEMSRWTRGEEMRVARILKTLGFERYRKREGASSFWRYRRP